MPIVNAPMGGVAGGRLAAAVTAAGGLGMIGMGSTATQASLAEQLRQVTGRFGIGLVDWVMRDEVGLLEDALAARPALLSVSFGTDWSWVDKAHDAGIVTATQVYDGAGARRAVDAGVDIVVARGAEGGGHGEVRLGTLPLLDAVLEAVSVPVLAGGGIASPRSLAAVLAAGASGPGWAPAWRRARGADQREYPSGVDRGPRNRYPGEPGIRRRRRPALAGAVPLTGVGQRLRRAMDGPGG
ncbi:nitronate monooxygenase family protein [Mycobacterium kansasii]|uniref:Nitronate monooxygenase family protein n=1 Tax=Mycobacterium kansasii TaxID=1768 RepID=A0A1V3WGQ9_MYCKA|nr:nitronate monooxygenase family protein [Mycobacterium kansasii]